MSVFWKTFALFAILYVDVTLAIKHPKSKIQINNLEANKTWQATDFCSSFYLSSLLSDNMILQRGSPGASIFGWGKPQSNVKLFFNNNEYNTVISINTNKLNSCSWNIQLPPMPASNINQYYSITVQCINCETKPMNISLNNIQFGDIWVCTGQSNMALDVNHTLSWFYPNVTNTCSDYNIRGINIPLTASTTPVDSRIFYGQKNIYWYNALYANLTLHSMSAACYYFARNLYSMGINNKKVPLGIIDSSWGGSIIEEWISDIAQNGCDWRYCENYDGKSDEGVYFPGGPPCTHDSSDPHQSPGSIFNGMIYPLSNMSIYGALYYQGENNGFNPGYQLKNQGYSCMIPRMIEEWRELWNEEIPFGIISLHGWCSEEAANCWNDKNYSDIYTDRIYDPTPFNLAWLRWSQTAELGRVPNYLYGNYTFIVMAYDLMDQGYGIAKPPPQFYEGGLHPRNKMLLGERIARAALAIGYNDNNIAYTGPVVSDCYVNYNKELLMVIIDNSTDILRNEKIIIKYNFGFQVQINQTWGGWNNVTTNGIVDNSIIILDVSNVFKLDYMYNVSISAVRFGWQDNVGCWQPYWSYPYTTYSWTPWDDENFNCSEANYTVYSQPSNLPMIPFIYQINDDGNCLIQGNGTINNDRPTFNQKQFKTFQTQFQRL